VNRAGLWIVVALAGLAAALSFRARVDDGGTPGWDSASHGLQGFALAQDLSRLDVPNFVADAFGHRYRYPPGHPLALAGAYLVFGPTWWTAIGLSAVLFAALAIILYATAASPLAGWVSALLALSCPALLALSGMIMLDIPAAILMTLALRLYARSLTDDAAVRPLGWTLTVFMITAAQYAACAIVILATYEAWRNRAALREALARFVRSRALFHPAHVLIALVILIAIAIRVSGGWTIPIGSRTLSMTRAGGPLIVAAWLIGLRVAWLIWKRHFVDVPRRVRDIFLTAVVPIYVWVFVIYPPRFQQFAEWVARPPTVHARTDPEHWTFYPGYFLSDGHASIYVSVAVLLLVAASFIRRGNRFYQWAALAGMALVLAHHARQARFIVPFLPAWWILASETLAGFRYKRAATVAATVAIGIFGTGLYAYDLAEAVSPPPYQREYAKVLHWSVDVAGDPKSLRVIGGIEGLSRHLFEWEFRKRHDLRTMKMRYNLDLPENFDTDPEGPRKVYDGWISRDPEATVIALEPLEFPSLSALGVRKSDHLWPLFTAQYLRGELRYKVAAEREFPDSRLRVRIYRLINKSM
jgi:hypothetical protein